PVAPQGQGQPRALPDAHPQAVDRHHGRHRQDGAGAPAPQPLGRRRHRDQAVGADDMATAKGILGTKLGMTQIFTDDSRAVPVTVIQAGPCTVTQLRTKERDGYEAVQLAYGEARRGKANKPATGHFKAADAKPALHLVELRTDPSAYQRGQEITVDIFQAGERADVVGV